MTSKTLAVKPLTILNSSQIEAAIKSITGRGAKLDADIHQCASSALWHVAQHGDVTLLNKLIIAMPKSGRTNALVAWALHFGRLLQNADKSTRATAPLVVDKETEKLWAAAEAQDAPFWTFKAKEGVATWSYDTYQASLIKSIKGALDKVSDDAQRGVLMAALAAFQGVALPTPAAEAENVAEEV